MRDWYAPIVDAPVRARRSEGPARRAASLCGLAVLVMLVAPGCSRDRTVTLGWDSPRIIPPKYRILIDGRIVKEIPPPEVDALCHCMRVHVEVPRGRHSLRVEACSPVNECNASADIWTE